MNISKFKKVLFYSLSFFLFWLCIEATAYILLKLNLIPIINLKGRPLYYWKSRTPHPYLGYIEKDSDLNRVQFLDEKVKDKNHFLITIFGGSVGRQFCAFEKTKKILSEIVSKKFSNNDIIVKCLAQRGMRQPQQSIAYLLYGQKSDLVIFLEGTNELVRSTRLKKSIEFPMLQYSVVFYSEASQTLFYRLGVSLFSYILEWSKDFKIPSLQILNSLIEWASVKFVNQINQFESTKKHDLIAEISDEDRIEIWKKSLNNIDVLSHAFTKQYIFVVTQPNLGNKRNKTKNELEYIKKENLNYLSNLSELAEKNILKQNYKKIKFVSLSNLFHSINDERFIDGVHLNNQGLEEVSLAIAKEISRLNLKH